MLQINQEETLEKGNRPHEKERHGSGPKEEINKEIVPPKDIEQLWAGGYKEEVAELECE